MNSLRYRSYAGNTQRASVSTVCQKCLKKGHYSYECTTSTQDRPYVSRPSRTQQLLNPKLQPKLASDEPNNLLRKAGAADEQLAKAAEERGRKRRRLDDASERSSSSGSSTSVSTVSTNLSRSTSPKRSRPSAAPRHKEDENLTNGSSRAERHHGAGPASRPQPSEPYNQAERAHGDSRRREREVTGRSSRARSSSGSSSPKRSSSRRATSPSRRHHHRERSQDRSRISRPQEGRTREDRRRDASRSGQTGAEQRDRSPVRGSGRRRSMSPYSKRIALTQAMNSG